MTRRSSSELCAIINNKNDLLGALTKPTLRREKMCSSRFWPMNVPHKGQQQNQRHRHPATGIEKHSRSSGEGAPRQAHARPTRWPTEGSPLALLCLPGLEGKEGRCSGKRLEHGVLLEEKNMAPCTWIRQDAEKKRGVPPCNNASESFTSPWRWSTCADNMFRGVIGKKGSRAAKSLHALPPQYIVSARRQP